MLITDQNALLPLTTPYTTTTSTVLLCKAKEEVSTQIHHWEIYLWEDNHIGEVEPVIAYNEDTELPIEQLYYRALGLKRDTTFHVYVKAVDDQSTVSMQSNQATFDTYPKF